MGAPCPGQPPGELSCDEKIAYWMDRHREACEQLAAARAELARQEAVMVAADRLHEAYEAMLTGQSVGRLPDWQQKADAVSPEAAWNTCPLHGHYIARDRPGGELIDCPACTAAERSGGQGDG